MSPDSQQHSTAIKVAKVIDDFTLVLNHGSGQGVKEGQRFLIYAFGEDILDPNTNQSLGKLEVVRGTGRVTHLQNSMATIRSDMTSSPARSIRKVKQHNPFGSLINPFGVETVEDTLPAQVVPFDKPSLGDIAKPI